VVHITGLATTLRAIKNILSPLLQAQPAINCPPDSVQIFNRTHQRFLPESPAACMPHDHTTEPNLSCHDLLSVIVDDNLGATSPDYLVHQILHLPFQRYDGHPTPFL